MHRLMSFRKQRIAFTSITFLIVFFFTTSILWSHLDGIVKPEYQGMARFGLLLLPAIAVIMTIWELFVDKSPGQREHPLHPAVVRLVGWCFWGGITLALVEVLHSGAILKYDASIAESAQTMAAVGDAQAKIAREAAAGAIEASGRAAQDLNSVGQTRSAEKILRAGKDAAEASAAGAQAEVSRLAADHSRPETFLPDWYINGGMYVALPLLALIFFAITMALARVALPYVDADDDGQADVSQGGKNSQPAAATGTGTLYTLGADGRLHPVGQMAEGEARQRAIASQVRDELARQRDADLMAKAETDRPN